MTSYAVEWIPGPAFLAVLFPLLIVPSFALIALAVVALVAIAGLLALAWTMLRMPYRLALSLHRRLAERHRSREDRRAGEAIRVPAPMRSAPAEPVALLAEAHQPRVAADQWVVGE
jgi:hypothetical protein